MRFMLKAMRSDGDAPGNHVGKAVARATKVCGFSHRAMVCGELGAPLRKQKAAISEF
jgi:hypothetical protein